MTTFDGILQSGGFPGAYIFHIAGMPWAATNSPALKVFLDSNGGLGLGPLGVAPLGGSATADGLRRKLFGVVNTDPDPADVQILCILDNDLGSQTVDYGPDKGIRVGGWSVKLHGETGAGFSWDNGGAFSPNGILGLQWQPNIDYTDDDGVVTGAAHSVLYGDINPTTNSATANTVTLSWPQEKDWGLKDWLDANWGGASYDNDCDLWCGCSCLRPYAAVATNGTTHYSVACYTSIYNTPNEIVQSQVNGQNIYVTNFPQSIVGMPAYLYGVEMAPDGSVNSGTQPFTLRTGRVKPGVSDNGAGIWTIQCSGLTDQLKIKSKAPRAEMHIAKYHFNDNDLGLRSHARHMYIIESSTTNGYVGTEVTLATTNGHVIYDDIDDLWDAVEAAISAASITSIKRENRDLVVDSAGSYDFVAIGGIIPWILGIGYIHWSDIDKWLSSCLSLSGNDEFAAYKPDDTDPLRGGDFIYNNGGTAVGRLFSGALMKAYLRRDTEEETTILERGGEKFLRNTCTSPYFVQYDLNEGYLTPFAPQPIVPPISNVNSARRINIDGTVADIGNFQTGSWVAFGPPFNDTQQRVAQLGSTSSVYAYLPIATRDSTDGKMDFMPWGMSWPQGLQYALTNDQDYIAAFNDVFDSTGASILIPGDAETGSDNLTRSGAINGTYVTSSPIESAAVVVDSYYMDDPFVITDVTTVQASSPVDLLKDLLGDKDVTSTGISNAVKQTGTTDLVDRGQYNHLEMINWAGLQSVVDQSGLFNTKYTIKLRDSESDGGNPDTLDFDIVDLMQGILLTHGGSMVWEWNEAQRSYRIGFIVNGTETFASARVAGRVVTNNDTLMNAPSSGVEGGQWAYDSINTVLMRSDGGTEVFNVKGADSRAGFATNNKQFKFTDQMTVLATGGDGPRKQLISRISDMQQDNARIEYKHQIPARLSVLRRVEVGKTMIFSGDAVLDRSVGKRNNGIMLGSIYGVTTNLGAAPSINIDVVTRPDRILGIGPYMTIDTPVFDSGTTYTHTEGSAIDNAWLFECYDYIDGSYVDRGCSCTDYAIVIFERNTSALYYDAAYSYASQNVFEGTISVNSTFTTLTITIDGNVSAFNTVNAANGKWVIKFAGRDNANLQDCQTAYYGWYGMATNGGRCIDSGDVLHPAIKVGL